MSYAGEPIESVSLTDDGRLKLLWAVTWYSHQTETLNLPPETWRQLVQVAQAGYENSVKGIQT